MTKARSLPLLLALVTLDGACSAAEPCSVPGVAVACACGAGTGARVCSPEREWEPCDCSGTIALPVAVTPSEPSAGTGAGASGSGAGGTGVPNGRHDAGMPMRDSGSNDASSSDASTVDASIAPASEAYRACMADADCDPGAKCIITAGVPSTSVCAPACLNTVDCPVPEGTYEARVACVTGFCQLDCTPVLFAPLLSCPADMTCIVAALGSALCERDGM